MFRIYDAVFRFTMFLQWLMCSCLARCTVNRYPDLSMQAEDASFGAHMLFVSGLGGLPKSLQGHVIKRVKLAWLISLAMWVAL